MVGGEANSELPRPSFVRVRVCDCLCVGECVCVCVFIVVIFVFFFVRPLLIRLNKIQTHYSIRG